MSHRDETKEEAGETQSLRRPPTLALKVKELGNEPRHVGSL